MSYHQLVEGSRGLIISYLQANLGAQLDIVAANVTQPLMTLENPVQYFIFPKAKGLRLPAVFVICDDFDFRIQEMNSNFINAKAKFKISIYVEDQDEDILTYKTDRYLSALHQCLDESDIVSSDNKLKIKVIVTNATFSPLYSRTEGSGDGGKFRKEIMLLCDVDHYEGF